MTYAYANPMMKGVLLTAILIAVLGFGAREAAAQEDCTSLETVEAQSDCWEAKAKSGEKNLTKANLIEADLTEAILTGANLSGANLTYTSLTGANLRGTNLSGADLIEAILTKAIVHRSTTKGVDFDDWIKRGGKVVD